MNENLQAPGDCPVESYAYPSLAIGLAGAQYLIANRANLAADVPCALHCAYAALGAGLSMLPHSAGAVSAPVFVSTAESIDALAAELQAAGLAARDAAAEAADEAVPAAIDWRKWLAALAQILASLLNK